MLKLKTDYLYGLNDCLEDEYKEEYTVLVSNKFPLLPINDDRASQYHEASQYTISVIIYKMSLTIFEFHL